MIVDRGADVCAQDVNGHSALHEAARCWHLETVKALVELGANVNAQDKDGRTSLHEAAFNGNTNMVKVLVELGADMCMEDKCGDTALDVAVVRERIETVKALVELGADVCIQDRNRCLLLHLVAKMGCAETVRMIVDRGANVCAHDNDGRTALHEAARWGHTEMVKVLVELGADMCAQDACGDTAIHEAARWGRTEIVKALAELGTDVLAQDSHGLTLLQKASLWGHTETVEALVQMGVGAGTQCQGKSTALVLAIGNGHDGTVPVVEEAVVVPIHYSQNQDESPSHHKTSVDGHMGVAKVPAEHSRPRNVQYTSKSPAAQLLESAHEGRLAAVRKLVKQGVDVNVRNQGGDTALHLAAVNGHVETMKALVQLGLDVNARDELRGTPLHEAAANGQTEAVQALFRLGADVCARDQDDDTALHLAAITGHAQTVQILLELGADAHAQNQDGHTALHLAAENGHTDLMKMLKKVFKSSGNFTSNAQEGSLGDAETVNSSWLPTQETTALPAKGQVNGASAPTAHSLGKGAVAEVSTDAVKPQPTKPRSKSSARPKPRKLMDRARSSVCKLKSKIASFSSSASTPTVPDAKSSMLNLPKPRSLVVDGSSSAVGVSSPSLNATTSEYNKTPVKEAGLSAAEDPQDAGDSKPDARNLPLQEPLTVDVGVVDQEHSVPDAAKGSHQPDVQNASEVFHFEAYTSAELAKATNNFSHETVIGEGKIGKVYIGTLRKMPVAIKMLHPHYMQGREDICSKLKDISAISHQNLLKLFGWCPQELCLVYELCGRKSLEDCLPQLRWYDRVRVAKEVSQALLFLHKRSPEEVIHQSIKPSNVMFDSSWNVKLADVGLSNILLSVGVSTVGRGPSYKSASPFAGTLAYMDPECLRTGQVVLSSDVYSLGILMLQMLTGMSADGDVPIQDIVEDALETEHDSFVDQEAGHWPWSLVLPFATLALQCVSSRRSKRPDLETAILPQLEQLHAQCQAGNSG